MKKSVLIYGILFVALLSFSFISALNDTSTAGFSCLRDAVNNCTDLSLDEATFTYLADGQCRSELMDYSLNDGECWPESNCNLKATSQAILALGNNVDDAESWLLDKNGTTTSEMEWYLQIDSNGAYQCSINYDGGSNTLTTEVVFGADKKLSENINTGTCFEGSVGDYWPTIRSSCLDKEFTVSCNESFLTSLIYTKNEAGSPLYISGNTQSAAANGEIDGIKANSYCFKSGNVCSYEGTLWATLAIDYLGGDIKPYLPYLITMREDYQTLFPSTFIWYLTGDTLFYNELIGKQTNFGDDSYWQVSSQGKYFDTALALFSLNQESPERQNSITWLENVQGDDGCWNNGNVRDTAFILYSLYGKRTSEDTGGIASPDCESSGYYCMSSASCELEASGSILPGYSCPIPSSCCDSPIVLDTCADLNGVICGPSQTKCTGGQIVESSDTLEGGICCVSGTCELPSTSGADCEVNGGTCRVHGCNSNEEESFTYTCDFGDSCCFDSNGNGGNGGSSGGNYTWVWILVILIILAIVGILFKDNLRKFFLRFKSGNGHSSGGPRRPSMPSAPLMRQSPGPMRHYEPPRRPSRSGDMDDVLKKLREMGN